MDDQTHTHTYYFFTLIHLHHQYLKILYTLWKHCLFIIIFILCDQINCIYTQSMNWIFVCVFCSSLWISHCECVCVCVCVYVYFSNGIWHQKKKKNQKQNWPHLCFLYIYIFFSSKISSFCFTYLTIQQYIFNSPL